MAAAPDRALDPLDSRPAHRLRAARRAEVPLDRPLVRMHPARPAALIWAVEPVRPEHPRDAHDVDHEPPAGRAARHVQHRGEQLVRRRLVVDRRRDRATNAGAAHTTDHGAWRHPQSDRRPTRPPCTGRTPAQTADEPEPTDRRLHDVPLCGLFLPWPKRVVGRQATCQPLRVAHLRDLVLHQRMDVHRSPFWLPGSSLDARICASDDRRMTGG